eukprot:1099189-Amphidinium_carterae.1
MVRLPDVQSQVLDAASCSVLCHVRSLQQEMFEGLKDYLPKIPSGALPLWARTTIVVSGEPSVDDGGMPLN